MQHTITISPQVALPGAAECSASVAGAVLTVNGVEYDLSGIADGGEWDPEGVGPFIGTVTRAGAVLSYTMRLTYCGATALPVQTRTDWTVTVEDEALPDLIARVSE